MSNLIPSIIALDKGLDLQTAKIAAPPGSVLDSLNYEQVDFQGQKRIDGYVRYDGTVLSAQSDFLLVNPATVGYGPASDWNSEVGYPVVVYYNDVLLGIATQQYTNKGDTYDFVAVINYNTIPDGAVFASKSDLFTPEAHKELLLDVNSILREMVEELPGPISGLHWFRDRLYAVVDLETYTPEDTKINTSGNASLFESRNVQQVIDEDAPGPYNFGWKFVHQGWKVLFENGTSLYGTLPAVNQNRQGVGIEGPTSIELNNGAASVVTQNVAITNVEDQVSGWKDSNTSTTYTLNPSAIQYDDSAYIYADAYIYWNAEAGVVVGDDGVLEENSPTNKVELT